MNVQLNCQAAGGRTGDREWGLCAPALTYYSSVLGLRRLNPVRPALQNCELAAAEVASCRQPYAQQHEARDRPR